VPDNMLINWNADTPGTRVSVRCGRKVPATTEETPAGIVRLTDFHARRVLARILSLVRRQFSAVNYDHGEKNKGKRRSVFVGELWTKIETARLFPAKLSSSSPSRRESSRKSSRK